MKSEERDGRPASVLAFQLVALPAAVLASELASPPPSQLASESASVLHLEQHQVL